MTLPFVFGVAALAAWLSAVIHSVWVLAHLSGKSSLMQMLLNGFRWFDAENFTPRGQRLLKRLVLSAMAFLCCGLAMVLMDRLASSGRSL